MQNIIVIRHGQPQTLSTDEVAHFAFAAGDEVLIRTSDGTTPAQFRVRGNDLVLLTPNGEVLMPNLAALLADASVPLYFNSVLIEMTTENGAVQLEAHRTVDAAEAIHSAPIAFAQADENAQVDDKVATAIGQIESEPPASGGAVQFGDLSAGFASSLGNSVLGQTGVGYNSSQGASGQISTASISSGSSGNFSSAPVFSISSGQSVSVGTTTTTATDTSAPITPSLNVNDDIGATIGSVQTAGYTDDAHPTFNGSAEAGSTVNLYDQFNAIGSAIAGADGHWQFTPGSVLSDGSHSIRATATDAAGNTSLISDAFVFNVDTVAPEITFLWPSAAADQHVLYGYVTEGNTTVSFYDNGQLVASRLTAADDNNPHAFFFQEVALTDGLHRITYDLTDAAGNTAQSSSEALISVANGVWSPGVLPETAPLVVSNGDFEAYYTAVPTDASASAALNPGMLDSLTAVNTDGFGVPNAIPFTLDFTQFTPFDGGPRLQSLERVDLTGSNDNSLILRAQDVLDMSDVGLLKYFTSWEGASLTADAHQFIVDGNDGDSLKLADPENWQSAGTATHDGQTYAVYNSTTHDSNGANAQVLVNTHVAVIEQPHAALPVTG